MSTPLDDIRIASPCHASWNEMAGDERVRHCSLCKLNVYDLSGLTTQEGLDLLAKSDGRLCLRVWRRKDGTVLTADCPVGVLARLRRRRRAIAAGIGLLMSSLLAALALNETKRGKRVLTALNAIRGDDCDVIAGRVAHDAPPLPVYVEMGDYAGPPAQPEPPVQR